MYIGTYVYAGRGTEEEALTTPNPRPSRRPIH
jgi:hypothetical protein